MDQSQEGIPVVMETTRKRILSFLQDNPATIRDVSKKFHISEREALYHLEHLASGRNARYGLEILPARCRNCGFVFRKRRKVRCPSRCPVCRSEQIVRPEYRIR
ncbi:MAG TPA: transcriptional regulator [Thermodesulfobacteriaceae bacterium]|nr:transcriptional regulator [Thermodesulfobacteriaceae bacterium]